jgi:hypothetical protein
MASVQRTCVAPGHLPRLSEEPLALARQLGESRIQLTMPDLPGDRRWDVVDLRRSRETCEAANLRFKAIESLPNHVYEHCMIGEPKRDDEIEHVDHDTQPRRSGSLRSRLELRARVCLAHLDAPRRSRGRIGQRI